jgi:hypothetical protein
MTPLSPRKFAHAKVAHGFSHQGRTSTATVLAAALVAMGCSSSTAPSGEVADTELASASTACAHLTHKTFFSVGPSSISSLDVLGNLIVVGITETDESPARAVFFHEDGSKVADLTLGPSAFVTGAARFTDGSLVIANGGGFHDTRLLFVTLDAGGPRITATFEEIGGGRIDTAPVVLADDTAVAGTDDGRVVFVDRAGRRKAVFSPRPEGSFQSFAFVDASPSVLADGVLVAISSSPRGVYFFDEKGAEKAAFQTDPAGSGFINESSFGTVQLPDGTVVAAGDVGAMSFTKKGQRKNLTAAPSIAAPVLTSKGTAALPTGDGAIAFVSGAGGARKTPALIAQTSLWQGAVALHRYLVLTYLDVSDDKSHLLVVDENGTPKQRSDLFLLGRPLMKQVNDHAVVIAEVELGNVHIFACDGR